MSPVGSRRLEPSGEAGFSLAELLVAVTVLLIVSSAVTSGLLQLTNVQHTISNRTEMHAGVRSATELLQQEIGQAGKVSLPSDNCGALPCAKLSSGVATGAQTVGITQRINGANVSSVAGIFAGEYLSIDGGSNKETVTVTAVDTGSNQITATFAKAHAADAAVNVYGGFATGIVPPSPGFTNGSDSTHLKMYGDINGDGSMVYVEYTCDITGGNLYRNVMPFDQTTAKAVVTSSQILVTNILANPGGTACFTYMPSPLPVVNGNTYVLDVAITMTVQTQLKDRITQQYQTETKALLNVSPRNVFDVWQLASASVTDRIQPMPATVTALLPTLSP